MGIKKGSDPSSLAEVCKTLQKIVQIAYILAYLALAYYKRYVIARGCRIQ